MRGLLRWLIGNKGDMVWNALVIITVMIPLMGLTIDVPRYFILRSTLQNAVDAAAESAAQTTDAAAFINAGDQRLLDRGAVLYAHRVFDAVAAPMTAKGYDLVLDGIHIDEARHRVTATGHGALRYLFGLTPSVTLRVQGTSSFRSIRE